MKRSFTLMMCTLLVCLYASSSPRSFIPLSPYSGIEQIRSNLYVRPPGSSPILMDGDLTQYDPSYSNTLDGLDARKMNNFSENIGMIRGTNVLVIERRQTISLTDTIFYKTWQLQQRLYQLEFITSNLDHPGLEGFLEDSYLKTSVPINLNGTTTADFSVIADPASAAVYRFRIVFKTVVSGPLPLTFTSIKAYGQEKKIRIDWKTENEVNMKGYGVEKSIDGSRFINAANVKANNFAINNYTWVDEFPANGYNYYRIINTGIDGEAKYSSVLKVFIEKNNSEITVYPNPVINNTIHLHIKDQPAGQYQIRLINSFGEPVFLSKITHEGGDITQTLRPNQTIAKGVYQLEVTTPGNKKLFEKIVY